MRSAAVGPDGAELRWFELPGPDERSRVFLHGLGGASVPRFLDLAANDRLPPARALLLDLLGFGFSDRPQNFCYTLDEHTEAVAAALDAARVSGADVIAHSMGGAIALLLTYRRPDLVSRLVLAEPNLLPWDGVGSPTIARQAEGHFVRCGFAELLAATSPRRAAVLRLADPVAMHRSARSLCEGSEPMMRDLLLSLSVPRTLQWGTESTRRTDLNDLRACGIDVVEISGAGHMIMEDDPAGYRESVVAALWL